MWRVVGTSEHGPSSEVGRHAGKLYLRDRLVELPSAWKGVMREERGRQAWDEGGIALILRSDWGRSWLGLLHGSGMWLSVNPCRVAESGEPLTCAGRDAWEAGWTMDEVQQAHSLKRHACLLGAFYYQHVSMRGVPGLLAVGPLCMAL